MNRAVRWNEAALVAVACWAVSIPGYGVLAAPDEPHVPVAPLIGVGLVQWFRGAPPHLADRGCGRPLGAVVLFGLVGALRPGVDPYVVDAPATGAAATIAPAVLTLVGRGAGRRRNS
ncbi:hypothetical protein ACFU9X_12040 [Streptomyces atratus]|uniref:hypothetical protein n=1 Tax=Streptomyces atratus TaxID=1893 RepID=UPI003676EDC3